MRSGERNIVTIEPTLACPGYPSGDSANSLSLSRLLRKKDSDILFFQGFGTKWVVLNSLKATIELFDKRGSKYADRPRFVLFEE